MSLGLVGLGIKQAECVAESRKELPGIFDLLFVPSLLVLPVASRRIHWIFISAVDPAIPVF